MRETRKLRLIQVALTVALCEAVGILGGLVTLPSISTWYQHLIKPDFTPPGWLFGPVWTLLYLLMGLSLFRAIIKHAKLKWFFLQLSLNLLWSYLFFGLHEIGLALLEILVLVVSIVATMLVFYRRDKLAANLLWPYLVWVCFASFLNFSLWLRN